MIDGIVIRIDNAAARRIRQSPEVIADLRRRAEAIRQATGDAEEFDVDEWVGRTRGRVTVATATPRAQALEAGGRVLSRAIDAGRL